MNEIGVSWLLSKIEKSLTKPTTPKKTRAKKRKLSGMLQLVVFQLIIVEIYPVELADDVDDSPLLHTSRTDHPDNNTPPVPFSVLNT